MIPAQFMVPRGLIMISKLTAGVPGPYRPLVEVWNANYSIGEEVEPVYSNQDCGPVIAYRDSIGSQPTIEGEVRDWSASNVALAVAGPEATVASAAGELTHTGALAAGDYLVLPEKGASALTVTDNAIPVVVDVDYSEYDLAGGVIKILTPMTGPVVCSYTYADQQRVDIGGLENDEYELVLIVKNRAGDCTRQRYTLWNTAVLQSGAMDLLAPNEDTDPRPIPLRFEANWVQAKKDAGESGYGKVEI